jgi:hypothetical protein
MGSAERHDVAGLFSAKVVEQIDESEQRGV